MRRLAVAVLAAGAALVPAAPDGRWVATAAVKPGALLNAAGIGP